jgi:parvulin-like peptidyl-prolyl isomerase
MIKYLASFALMLTTGFAGLIGGISMTVDNEPITLYEIQSYTQQNKVPVEEAVNRLIQRKIEEIEIRKLGIVASPYEVDKKMQEIAKQNGMTEAQFKKALVAEGHSEKRIRQDIEDKFKRDTLYKKIVGSSLKKPDEEELQSYYDLHQGEFNMPTSVELVEYISSSKEALELQQKQPMVNMPNIEVTQKTIDLKSINPQLAGLLVQTPDGSFTPVLNLGKVAGMFFIQKKIGKQNVSFAMAKQEIFARVMKSKEQAALIEYFEKKKSEANVKVIRRPN